jgi:hypothetical protein
MAARLLPPQHAGEDLLGIEIVALGIEQRFGIGLQDAWNEPRAHLRAARIAAGGIEREARDRLAVAHDVGDHRHHRGRHLGEIDAGIGERGIERNCGLADVDDAHYRCGPARRRSLHDGSS